MPIVAFLSSTITKGSPSFKKRSRTLSSALLIAQVYARSLMALHIVIFLSTLELAFKPTASHSASRLFSLVLSSNTLKGAEEALGKRGSLEPFASGIVRVVVFSTHEVS